MGESWRLLAYSAQPVLTNSGAFDNLILHESIFNYQHQRELYKTCLKVLILYIVVLFLL